MGKKAVDVVLLGDKAIRDKAIELNRRLVERFGDEIVLNRENCLPHVSLAMGSVEESLLGEVKSVLSEVIRRRRPGELEAIRINTSGGGAGREVSVLEVCGPGLQELHEDVMDSCAEYFTSDVDESMVLGDEVAESTLAWIRGYGEKSSFEKFSPHITIGYGRIVDEGLPICFRAEALAICHLGNHCTCRKVLWSEPFER